jgi:diguanylate cyclase (GGDEF)-like protein
MLGAYAKVKNLKWGILVTRPKSEIDTPLNSALKNILIWGVAGLLLALATIMFVTHRITRPLKMLNKSAEDITHDPKVCKRLKDAPKNCSNEVRNIWNSFANILALYQDSIHENNSMKVSSKKDIRQVMSNMRQQNTKKPINIDPVTGLTNGAFFVEELRKSLLIHRGEIAGLILIEVNSYKPLLAKGNEDLANITIKHVANIIKANTRDADIASRYGNAGRFAIFVNDCSPKSIQGTAKKLRSLVEVSPIEWKGNTVYIDLSIGIVGHKITDKTTVNTLMAFSERALIKSKTAGENKISTYQNKQIETT